SMNGEAASEPSARRLLNDWLGVSYTCGTVRDANCPSGTVIDEVACIELAPSGGDFPGNDDAVVLVGNGCPNLRSFDVLNTQSGSGGSLAGNELYRGPLKGDVPYHSISNQMTQGPFYKSVLDGASVHYRRDELTCSDPAPVEDRLTRVLNWFGYGSPQICEDPLAALDVDLGYEPEEAAQPTLSAFSPSPLRAAGIGAFHTSLEAPALAAIQIFDLQGRLIKEVHKGLLEAGNHRWSWNGGDERGKRVAQGVYFIRFHTSRADLTERLVVLN
ncbi:MAG: T9SS type A sorting domain-containing protein, partial [Candidatus Eisenbacteria bacterium]|nr:T9SS type A sorting domain-containing protein [Candidatus Eisenbacteria bacterium]